MILEPIGYTDERITAARKRTKITIEKFRKIIYFGKGFEGIY